MISIQTALSSRPSAYLSLTLVNQYGFMNKKAIPKLWALEWLNSILYSMNDLYDFVLTNITFFSIKGNPDFD